MGILQNPLGINLTNHNPLIDSPFEEGTGGGGGGPKDAFLLLDGTHFLLLDATDLLLLE